MLTFISVFAILRLFRIYIPVFYVFSFNENGLLTFLAHDAFVKTNRRAIVIMFLRPPVCLHVRPSVCLSVSDGRAL